ncbi:MULTISPECIES: hypothetical protein [Haloarcula]|jgi:hypothetical protein|uniref:Uncharacterized protein n=2 Tax=Haloarcula marismortui TaxID=2238 RepID=Q5V5J7_HALMA|nr:MULTISPECIES: hypothetical protein [Haloarcula]AAV45205.1 unknown [Haloarcula marismortui ATCC 43049]EMA21887.1 hypothetical protein C435_04643 [Haloarcula californiae ATCC 33799]NHN62224.1 hypothetical protein [Haloarcula sp. JP-Z28]NHX38944.1 hypothetical protein [Haloarcula sp. R1-2]QCP92987.1 hypothetical protein E6P14_19760 [Haloarcula marismortui ATCC 43049]
MTTDPSFSIPAHPQRRFPHGSGVEYEGGTEFRLIPEQEQATPDLAETVVDILAAGPYRYGDFHDLPMPLWLVRDEETTDVFRVAVRDGTVRLHVLPTTESDGLQRFFERLCETGEGGSWAVQRHVDGQ